MFIHFGKRRFNPCFNGFTTLTEGVWKKRPDLKGFNPCFNGFTTLTKYIIIMLLSNKLVSILVLMDSLL